MRCPIETQENAELLLSYSARRLDAEKMLAFEAHMASCHACREFHDSQAALWAALDQWEARPVSLDFDRRCIRKSKSSSSRAGGRGFSDRRGRCSFARRCLSRQPLAFCW